MDKRQILQGLKLGARVAEQEADMLGEYFVETEQWRQIDNGEVDVIFGPKGVGKSAIYSILLERQDQFWDRGVLLTPAENPRGTAAFSTLRPDSLSSEPELVALWKVYILSLAGSTLSEYGIRSSGGKEVIDALASANLLPPNSASLLTRLRNSIEYVRKRMKFETEVKFDPATGGVTGMIGRIALSEPGHGEASRGVLSVDRLLECAGSALESENVTLWVLFDRLDVAFTDSLDLEARALRALFRTYLDLFGVEGICLKIFLRTDIWDTLTEEGFREASHITRTTTIEWSPLSLLNLMCRRLLTNSELVQEYGVDVQRTLADVGEQRSFFDRLFPDQVDQGKNPKTFEWLVSRVADGAGQSAPRELIHLVTEARGVQLQMFARGQENPSGEWLFTAAALKEALPTVSKVHVEQTLYAEHPELKMFLQKLEGQKTNQDASSLADIWTLALDEARDIAEKLVKVGVFEKRDNGRYWVPFLYRSGLSMVQGSAAPV